MGTVAIASSALAPQQPLASQSLTAKVPSVFPLSKEQKRTYSIYTAVNPYYWIQREYLFWKECYESRSLILERARSGLAIGAFVGGLTGFVASRLLRDDEDKEKDREVTLKMTTWGVGIGASIGALFNGQKTLREIHQAPEYYLWKEEAIKNKVFPLFKQFLKETDGLRDVLCPIGFDLITHPVKVRSPNGVETTYEKKRIEDWIDNQTARFAGKWETMTDKEKAEAEICFDPKRTCYLKKEMLEYDYDYHRRVAVALRSVFDQQLDEEVKAGLLSYQTAMLKDRDALMKEILADIAARCASGAITVDEFTQTVRNCHEHYGIAR